MAMKIGRDFPADFYSGLFYRTTVTPALHRTQVQVWRNLLVFVR